MFETAVTDKEKGTRHMTYPFSYEKSRGDKTK